MIKHDKCAPFEAEIANLKILIEKRETLFIKQSSDDKEEIQKLRLQKNKLIEALQACLVLDPIDPYGRQDMIRRVLSETKE